MSGWGAEHHLLRVPSSANREERALDVALAAIDRVLTLADQMDKAPDAHTRALAASIRNAVTGAAPMAEQMTFIISRKGDRWWGRTFGAPDWSVFSNNRAEVERACREFVAERTGRPSSETTILFVDEPPSSPQRDALCAIDDRLSSLEYEVGGLRVVVNEALLLEARSDSDRAVERVRKLAERAMSIVSRGCTCYGDDCTGKCRRGEPMGWDLDPAQVLAALDGESGG